MKTCSTLKPSVLEAVGNGSYLYHWNIEETEVENHTSADSDEETTEKRTQYTAQEVSVWEPITANKILSAVISDRWDSNYEQKLINEFNAANLGVYSETEAAEKIEAYTNFLTKRAAIKSQVDADCKKLNIE